MLRNRRHPTSSHSKLDKLNIQVLIGIKPVHTARIFVGVGISVFYRQLCLSQATKAIEGCCLSNGSTSTRNQLIADCIQFRATTNDLITLLRKWDMDVTF